MKWKAGLKRYWVYLVLALAVLNFWLGNYLRAVLFVIAGLLLLQPISYEAGPRGLKMGNIFFRKEYAWNKFKGWSTSSMFGHSYLVLLRKDSKLFQKGYAFLPADHSEVKKILSIVSKYLKAA